jgi:hypothetical protein
MSEEKKVKKVAPHWTQLQTFTEKQTVVQPYFCQSTKLWVVRILKGYGELVLRKEFKNRDDAKFFFEQLKNGYNGE